MRIDRPTLPFKLFNLAMYGGYSVFYFYCPLLLSRRGVPATLIGSVLALKPIVGTLVTPAWTAAADALSAHRCLHSVVLVIGSSSRLLYLVAPIDPAPLLLLAAALSEALTCSIIPLSDAATFMGLERLGRSRDDYAQQRLWGAISAGWIFLPLAGALMSACPRDAAWSLVLGFHIGLLSLSAIVPIWSVGLRASQPTPTPAAAGGGRASRPTARAAFALLIHTTLLRSSWRGRVRCVIFLCCGAFHAVTEGYIFLYLDTLHGSELLDGLAITFTCLSEVLVMAISERIVRRLGGLDGCLLLVLVCYLLRFVGYACLPAMPYTWVILPIQLLHGITFGLYWTIGVQWAAACTPAGLPATLQGAFAALISLGQTIALTLGGYAFERVGGAKLYAVAGLVAACVGLVAACLAACGSDVAGRRGCGCCCHSSAVRIGGGGGGGGGGGRGQPPSAWSSSIADVVLEDFDAMDEGEADNAEGDGGTGTAGAGPTLLRPGDVRSHSKV